MDKSKAIIILGTPHLGTTPGKCSPDGKIKEAAYGRERVDAIKSKLESYGYKVFVDYMPMEPNAQMKASYWKDEQVKELNFRKNFVNNLCAKYGSNSCIYVSLHLNGFGNKGQWEGKRGWCVFTSPGKTKADDLATCLWKCADKYIPKDNKNAIRADWSDKDPDFEAKLFVLTHTKCPAVLTENFFQDNKDDVAYLLSDEGKHAIERIHVEGIIKFIDSL